MSDVHKNNEIDVPGSVPQTTAASDQLELKLPDESGEIKDLGLWAGVLVLLAMVAYWPATGGRFLFRDDHAVTDNFWVRIPNALGPAWLFRWQQPAAYPFELYQPVTATAYWLEYRLGGHAELGTGPVAALASALPPPTPLAFHLANLIFHAGAAVLLWLALRELKLPGAWVVAAIFTLHPLNTEPVSWIADQGWVLGGLFFFASAYLYLTYVKHRELDDADRASGGPGLDPLLVWGLYTGAAAAYVLALLAHPATAPLPAALLLALWWRRRMTSWDYLLLLPLLAVAVAVWLSTGDLKVDGAHSLWHRGAEAQLAAVGSGFFSCLRVIAPLSLKVFHNQWYPEQWWLGAFAVACWAGVTGLFWIQKDRWGRGLFAGSLIYGLLQLCSLNWFESARLADFADATSYLAGVPVIALVTILVLELFKQAVQPARFARVAVTVSTALLVVLGAVTWSRAHVFESPVAFWQDAADKNPQSSFALSELAEALRLRAIENASQGETDSVNAGLLECIARAKDAVTADPRNAAAHRVWANALVAQGEIKASLEHFQKASELQPYDFLSHLQYGSAFCAIRMWKEAIPQLNAALRLETSMLTVEDSAMVHRLLGEAYGELGNNKRALVEEQLSLERNPLDTVAILTFAKEQAKAGLFTESLTNYARAIAADKANQSSPEIMIAIAKIKEQQYEWDKAVQYYQLALQLDPKNTGVAEAIKVDTEKAKKAAATRPSTTQASPTQAATVTTQPAGQ